MKLFKRKQVNTPPRVVSDLVAPLARQTPAPPAPPVLTDADIERVVNGIAEHAGITAIMPTGTRKEGAPYYLDYPWHFWIAQNPRQLPGKKVSVDVLRDFADRCDILRSAIEAIKRDVKSQPLIVRPLDASDQSEETNRQIAEAQAFIGVNGGLGGHRCERRIFEDKIINDLLILGVYEGWRMRDRRARDIEVHPVDPATTRPRVDATGWPDPDTPYEQFIQGVQVCRFAPGELRYDGLHPRTDTPYFTSPIEWLLSPLSAMIKADDWNRAWLSGSTSHMGDVYTLPAELSIQQVREFIELWQAMRSGDSIERQNTKFLPGNSQKISDHSRHDMDFQEYEMWLLRRVCSIYGVQPAALGYVGEQYKVTQEASFSETARVGVGAVLAVLEDFYDDLLASAGWPNLTAEYLTDDEAQKGKRSERLTKEAGGAYKTINEVRAEAGLPPIEGGDVVPGSGSTEPKPQPNPEDKTEEEPDDQ